MPMPPYVDAIGNILRVTTAVVIVGGTGGQQVQEMNPCYVVSATGGGDSRANLAAAIDANVNAVFAPLMTATTKLYGSKVSVLNQFPPPIAVTTLAGNMGTSVADQLPTQTRGLIQLATIVGGRSGRGRLYSFTPDRLQNTIAGNPSPAFQTALMTFAVNLTPITVGGTTYTQVVLHRSKTKPFTYTYDLVVNSIASDRWATQRRSGDFGRANANPW